MNFFRTPSLAGSSGKDSPSLTGWGIAFPNQALRSDGMKAYEKLRVDCEPPAWELMGVPDEARKTFALLHSRVGEVPSDHQSIMTLLEDPRLNIGTVVINSWEFAAKDARTRERTTIRCRPRVRHSPCALMASEEASVEPAPLAAARIDGLLHPGRQRRLRLDLVEPEQRIGDPRHLARIVLGRACRQQHRHIRHAQVAQLIRCAVSVLQVPLANDADDERRAVSHGDDFLGVVGREQHQRELSAQSRERAPHRLRARDAHQLA